MSVCRRPRPFVLAVSCSMLALLLTTGASLAWYSSWSQSGYTLEGQTNPIDYQTRQDCGDPIVCPPYTLFRAASFSKTPNGSATVGVLNEAGDTCTEGGGQFPKQTAGWNWLWNQPNTWVTAMTGWVRAQNCLQGHSYRVRGTHNLQNGGSTVNFSGTTEAG
jgi:hypothetical protein